MPCSAHQGTQCHDGWMSTFETDPSNTSKPDEPQLELDQLPREDTLEQIEDEDILDEGYTPRTDPRPGLYETPREVTDGLTITEELAAETPDVWDEPDEGDDSQPGRLSVDDDALDGRGNDLYAVDKGAAGGLESAEEAAMHVEDDA
ncbi:hypothetical protein SAMN06309944_0851 [Micrococcales bacterium KH10]|nr:hypothetical protein SAMN06309944_0851 [Micrococcales bacterium KH10]